MCGFDYDTVDHDLPVADVLGEYDNWDDFCANEAYEDIQAAIEYLCEKGFRIGLDLRRTV